MENICKLVDIIIKIEIYNQQIFNIYDNYIPDKYAVYINYNTAFKINLIYTLVYLALFTLIIPINHNIVKYAISVTNNLSPKLIFDYEAFLNRIKIILNLSINNDFI